jgi:pyruvate-formate lyase
MSVAPLLINGMRTHADADFVRTFTDVHRAHANAHPARREAACLKTQFPALLLPRRDGDVLAGRRCYQPVGLDADMSLGYTFSEPVLAPLLAEHPDLALCADYWCTENTPAKVRAAFPPEVAEALPKDGHLDAELAAYALYRMAGTVADYGKLIRLGLPGLRDEVDAALAAAGNDDEAALCEGWLAVCDVLETCIEFYDLPESVKQPQTAHDALQLAWLYTLIAGQQNFGRMDVWFGDWMAADLDSGRLTEGEAIDLLCGFWKMAEEELNLMNARIVVGGSGRPNDANADRFTFLALEAARRTKVTRPQLSLRWYEGMNSNLWKTALEVLGTGTTFPILYNDDVNISAVQEALDVSPQDSVDYVPYGCGEYVIEHRSVGSPNGIINLLKCLELALFDGVDPKTGIRRGPATGRLSDFQDFEQLWSAYAAQVEVSLKALATAQLLTLDVAAQEAGFLTHGLLQDDCVARRKPWLSGGIRYRGGLLESYGNVNAADSLLAIKKTVFEERSIAPPTLLASMRKNFEGFSLERRKLNAVPRFGNADPEADAMMQRVHEHVCIKAAEFGKAAGLDHYRVVIINNWNNTAQGHACLASADGRADEGPLVSGVGARPGADRKGVTALLRSNASLRPEIHAGAVHNIKFDQELFTQHLDELSSLLVTYFRLGGTQAMITVVNQDDLLDALEHPERHGSLVVRVGGFSARFVTLPKEVQLEVISRTVQA